MPCQKFDVCKKRKTLDFVRMFCTPNDDSWERCRLYDGVITWEEERPIQEWMFERQIGCERCGKDRLSGLQYSPNEDKELYLCDTCAYREFIEAETLSVQSLTSTTNNEMDA